MELNLDSLCKATGKLELEFDNGVIKFSGTLTCNEDGTIPPVDPPDPPDPPAGVETIFMQTYADSPLTDKYNEDDAERDLKGETVNSNGIGWEDKYNVKIIDDVSRLLKVTARANEWDPSAGCMFGKVLEGYDELWFSYNVRFSPDFDPVRGGKLMGLTGGDINGPGGGGVGSGFSSRMMFRENCELMIYCYYPDMTGDYGQSFGSFPDPDNPDELFSFYTEGGDRWFNLTQRVVLNQWDSTSDGFIEVFIDGKLVQRTSNLRLRGENSVQIDKMMIVYFFGGNDESYAPDEEQHIFIDDLHLFQVPETVGQKSEDGADISAYLLNFPK